MSHERELSWLRRVRDVSQRLASEPDPQRVLPLILDAAIEAAGAERGFLVLVRGRRADGRPQPEVVEARGFDQEALAGPQVKVSRRVVRRVLDEAPEGLVTTSEEHADLLQVSSVRDRRVRSILCVPMRLRGETRGVLYLDHRFTPEAFQAGDLPAMRVFAGQAALALETAQRARPEPTPAAPPPPTRSLCRYGRLVGGSEAMLALYEELERATRCREPVLILGEAGVGKGLVARELHVRWAGEAAPLHELHAGLDGEALGEALSGEGTLVLRDLEGLDGEQQARLIRAIRAGGAGPRVLALSRSDLRERVARGSLRADLYYRLDVMRLVVPPLRQRAEDLPLLLAHLVELEGGRALRLSPEAQRVLSDYAWPGNVRELRNEVRRLLLSGETRISTQQLSAELREGRGVIGARGSFSGMTLGQVEEAMVRAAMEKARGVKARAARSLGIPRSSLYHLLDRYGIV